MEKNTHNKLLFVSRNDFPIDIILVANNHKDLEEYLNANFGWYKVVMSDDSVKIIEREGYEAVYVRLVWAKHI